MKTKIMIATMLVYATMLTAQNIKEKRTIRIKKVENVNGVERIIDTTYTIDGPITLSTFSDLDQMEGKSDCKGKKMVIVTNEIHGENLTVIESESEMDEQMQKALKAAGVDGKALGVDKMIVVNLEEESDSNEGNKKTTKVVIVKTIKITDPSKEDEQMLSKQTGISDKKLQVEDMRFYPNPNDGKFNLDFQIPTKGNTEVTILNIEGKSIYSENLNDFSGNYSKPLDISDQPKGIYFVKLKQGEHAQVKKIVLE